MKKSIFTLSSLFIFFCTYAQNNPETEIRKLDSAQKEAYFKTYSTSTGSPVPPLRLSVSPGGFIPDAANTSGNL